MIFWKFACFLLIYCLASLSPWYFLFLLPVLSLACLIILIQQIFWGKDAELTQQLLEHLEKIIQASESTICFLDSGQLTWLQYLCFSLWWVRGKPNFPLTQAASKVLTNADCAELICDAGIHPSGMMTDPSACFILAINRKSSFFK